MGCAGKGELKDTNSLRKTPVSVLCCSSSVTHPQSIYKSEFLNQVRQSFRDFGNFSHFFREGLSSVSCSTDLLNTLLQMQLTACTGLPLHYMQFTCTRLRCCHWYWTTGWQWVTFYQTDETLCPVPVAAGTYWSLTLVIRTMADLYTGLLIRN